MSWIQTYTGRAFSLVDPDPATVDIEDIAQALSNVCRYTGHCKTFYSVAQHSVMVASMLPPELRMQGLLHDATEAYVADLSRPLKSLLPEYKIIEDRVWRAIAFRFGLPEKLDPEVKRIDNVALMVERRDLLGPQPQPWAPELEALVPDLPVRGIVGWRPGEARRWFMDAFNNMGSGLCSPTQWKCTHPRHAYMKTVTDNSNVAARMGREGWTVEPIA